MMMRVDLVGWALLLIALALGFSVLHKAAKDTSKILKLLGNVIGIIILVVCLVLAISDLSSRMRVKKGPMVGPRRAGDITRPVTPPTLPKMPVMPKTEVPPAPPKP